MALRVAGFARDRKVIVVGLTQAVCAAAYLASLNLGVRPAAFLPNTALDLAIPFWPPAILIYLLHFAVLVATLAAIERPLAINRLNASMALAAALATTAFILAPTCIPRQSLASVAPSLRPLYRLVLFFDDPHGNCLPSLHVCFAFLAALAYRDQYRRLYPFALAWACLVAASTLLIKQHYAVDVLAGLVLACACRWGVERGVEFVLPQERASAGAIASMSSAARSR